MNTKLYECMKYYWYRTVSEDMRNEDSFKIYINNLTNLELLEEIGYVLEHDSFIKDCL